MQLTYIAEPGRKYTFEYTGDWLNSAPWGNPITTTLDPTTGFDELFYRVRVGP